MDHLAGVQDFGQLGPDLSREALVLTRDLKGSADQAALAAEVRAAHRP